MQLPPLKKIQTTATKTKSSKSSRSTMQQVGLFGALGLQLVVSFLVCFWVGIKLDEKLATAPVFLLLSVFVGMAVCGLQIYWLIKSEKL